MRASFVDQPGIEPRFSEPKSDVIAFIPLVNNFVVFEIGCKGTTKNAHDQIFWQKNAFFSQKSVFFQEKWRSWAAFCDRSFGGITQLSMNCTQKVRHKTKCRLWSIH